MKITIVLMALLLPLTVVVQTRAEDKADADQWDECKTILIPACERFLAAFSNKKEMDSWNKKIDENIVDKVAGNQALTDFSAFQSIALDWAADNRKKIEKKDRGAIKVACMLFVRFSKTGIPPPGQVREELTASNARELAGWLNENSETVENKGKGK